MRSDPPSPVDSTIDSPGDAPVDSPVVSPGDSPFDTPVDSSVAHSRRVDLTLSDIWSATIASGLIGVTAIDGTTLWRIGRLVVVVLICTGVALVLRSSHRVAADWLAVAFGALAIAVGGTIGFAHLSTNGPTIKAIGGLLAFVGGLVVVVTGAARLVRAVRGWRRLVALPIAALIGYVIVMPTAIAVYATNVPRPALGSVTPADRGLTFEDAAFVTVDDVMLSGWYIPSTNGAAVVLLHGASSTRSNVLDHAVVLARHGYGVLLFDARGHGGSDGRAMEFGWYGDRDIAAAIDYLERRDDVDPARIGGVGMSMGGEQVVGAMGHDPRLAAAVAEGATNRVYADKQWLAEQYGLRGRLQRSVDWLTYGLTDLLTEASPPISLRAAVAAAAPRPVLLIAAGNVADEQRASDAIRAGSPSTVQLWVVTDADHTGGLRTDATAWEQHVIAFLDMHLA